jgi:hypothetical protein
MKRLSVTHADFHQKQLLYRSGSSSTADTSKPTQSRISKVSSIDGDLSLTAKLTATSANENRHRRTPTNKQHDRDERSGGWNGGRKAGRRPKTAKNASRGKHPFPSRRHKLFLPYNELIAAILAATSLISDDQRRTKMNSASAC